MQKKEDKAIKARVEAEQAFKMTPQFLQSSRAQRGM